jgi:hypothetical protein
MKIEIITIEADQQRYPTAGDYIPTEDGVKILITKQKHPVYEKLIAIHELIEFWLSEYHGIPDEIITNYDLNWEERKSNNNVSADEPGNEHDCPYKNIHRIAENFERLLAREFGVDWFKYDKEINI